MLSCRNRPFLPYNRHWLSTASGTRTASSREEEFVQNQAVDSLFGPNNSTEQAYASRLLQGVLAALAGADANGVFKIDDEYFAIANLAAGGFAGTGDRIDDLVGDAVVTRDLQFDFAHEIYRVLVAAVDFGVALLAAVALNIRNGDATDARMTQRFAHSIELGRLDDRNDVFHAIILPSLRVTLKRS